jgi:DNA-binding protein HU-beta
MNKTEMAEKLAKNCELTKAKALEIIDTIFDTRAGKGIIAVELDAGREVRIAGFGTFDTRRSAARKGRNPGNGEVIDIPAKNHARFRAAKGLKERVKS